MDFGQMVHAGRRVSVGLAVFVGLLLHLTGAIPSGVVPRRELLEVEVLVVAVDAGLHHLLKIITVLHARAVPEVDQTSSYRANASFFRRGYRCRPHGADS